MIDIDKFDNNEKTIIIMFLFYTIIQFPCIAVIFAFILFFFYYKSSTPKKKEYDKKIELVQTYKIFAPHIYMDLNLLYFVDLVFQNLGLKIEDRNNNFVILDINNRVSSHFQDFLSAVENLCVYIKNYRDSSDKTKIKRDYDRYFFETLKRFHDMVYVLPEFTTMQEFTRYQKLLLQILSLQKKNIGLSPVKENSHF
jgi:hypothetical protein